MHRLLFEIPLGSFGAIPVRAFGAFLALALTLGLIVTVRLTDRAGLRRDAVEAACAAAILSGLLGARLGFVVLHPSAVASLGEALSLRLGGLSGAFGMTAGVAALTWVARRRHLPVSAVFDAVALGFGPALALARIGCWLEGCDYGRRLGPTAPAWLARLGTFPAGSLAWSDQVLARALPPGAALALPVHPSELYESALGLALLLGALALRRRQRASGVVALAVAGTWLALRVLVDWSRAPSPDVWSLRALLLAATVVTAAWWWRRAKARHP